MKVLIYKRTHKGDPDSDGVFGNQDCMGQVRNWNFDAVIGIGGKAPWKEDIDIKYKINWIGIEPRKIPADNSRGSKVIFGHFALYEENGPDIETQFPHLFEYMYGTQKRFDMSENLPELVFEEVTQILDSIRDSPPSEAHYLEESEEAEVEPVINCKGCYRKKDVEFEICMC